MVNMPNGYMPESLAEALKIRAESDVTLYAGGTDLMTRDRKGAVYLFLGKLPELKKITKYENNIGIGAAVTYTQALSSDLVPQIMKDAVCHIAAPAIRNIGTFGGNLANGSAKADSVLIDYVADAKVRMLSLRGERIVAVDKFYLGRKKLDIRKDEIIGEILLPASGLDNYYYEKVGGRQALAISRAAFAGVIRMDGDRIGSVAAAFGSVADTVLRFKDLENILAGKTLDEARAIKGELLQGYCERLALTEGRVSTEYRKTVCMNLFNEFLCQKGI